MQGRRCIEASTRFPWLQRTDSVQARLSILINVNGEAIHHARLLRLQRIPFLQASGGAFFR
jgi:hypothetical protein